MVSQLTFVLNLAFYLHGTIADFISNSYLASKSPNKVAFYEAIMETVTATSDIHCAGFCTRTSGCWGFKFHAANMTCHIRHRVTDDKTSTGMTDFTSFVTSGKKICPDNYIWNETLNFCYKLHLRRNTWVGAFSACTAEGGRLVIMDSVEKHMAVVNSLKEIETNMNYYVGAKRYSLYEDFKWIDGQPVDQIPWCPDQPNEAMCGSLWTTRGFCMDDNYCYEAEKFICEKPLG